MAPIFMKLLEKHFRNSGYTYRNNSIHRMVIRVTSYAGHFAHRHKSRHRQPSKIAGLGQDELGIAAETNGAVFVAMLSNKALSRSVRPP